MFHLFIFALGLHCCTQAFSSCGEWRRLLSGCGTWASHCGSFSCCRAQAHVDAKSLSPRALGLQQLLCTGSVASLHVESSQSRDGTCVLCLGKWSHWTTREDPKMVLDLQNSCRGGTECSHVLGTQFRCCEHPLSLCTFVITKKPTCFPPHFV